MSQFPWSSLGRGRRSGRAVRDAAVLFDSTFGECRIRLTGEWHIYFEWAEGSGQAAFSMRDCDRVRVDEEQRPLRLSVRFRPRGMYMREGDHGGMNLVVIDLHGEHEREEAHRLVGMVVHAFPGLAPTPVHGSDGGGHPFTDPHQGVPPDVLPRFEEVLDPSRGSSADYEGGLPVAPAGIRSPEPASAPRDEWDRGPWKDFSVHVRTRELHEEIRYRLRRPDRR
ncbi:hypothetical protein [Nocardiopsis sp. CC223A]|uniref:hypothetical protein n=1 Tax=Nocardiopsis sp. CC223A TaxID=3044051 RepID=UPI00278C57A4|nr:hypothetical protein [Nocardiopsis sp. CC223A]